MAVSTSRPRSCWSGHDRRRLVKALDHCRDVRLYRRLQALLRVAEGEPAAQAARALRVSRRSLHRWIKIYRQRRCPEDLLDQARPGRPREAEDLEADLLAAVLAQDPRPLGYRATSWTVPLLAAHLAEECGCRVSKRTLRRRLEEYGWRWKRPRYIYGEREAQVGRKKGAFAAA